MGEAHAPYQNRAKPVPNGACMEPESEATAPHTKRAKPDQIGAVPVDTHNKDLNSNFERYRLKIIFLEGDNS